MYVCLSVSVCLYVRTYIQTDRQTDRQTETETETDRQTDRQTYIHTYIHTSRWLRPYVFNIWMAPDRVEKAAHFQGKSLESVADWLGKKNPCSEVRLL